MKIENLINKTCFIFPFSNMTDVLKKHLLEKDVKIKGFIDNKNISKDIYSFKEAILDDFDYILILSPNHEDKIYTQCLKEIKKEKLLRVRYDEVSDAYKFFNNDIIERKDNLEEYFEKLKNSEYELENSILLIGIGFIDLNIKYLYLYLIKYTNLDVYIASDNKRDIEIFKSYDINVIDINSKEFIKKVFSSKIKIVDHNPTSKLLIESLKMGKSIQLWHGITIETLGVLTDYKVIEYDLVLSTSNFVSDYSFSKIYNYKELVNYGYPRNDVLYNDCELINVDLKLLQKVKNDDLKYIVYMPTHRPLGFEQNPINYEQLNLFAKENNYKVIIKMHPFVAEKLRDDLSSYQKQDIDLTNLIIYESHMDIYPILKHCDLLISDYSSVYFDFLYVNKPIVFFCYDYEEWVRGEQGVILDYFKHSPGDKCFTFDELLISIRENLLEDNYIVERKKIFNLMFENLNKKASELITHRIIGLFDD